MSQAIHIQRLCVVTTCNTWLYNVSIYQEGMGDLLIITIEKGAGDSYSAEMC